MTDTRGNGRSPRHPEDEQRGRGDRVHTPATGPEDTPAEYITGDHLAVLNPAVYADERLDEALDLVTAQRVWAWCHKYRIGKPETLADIPVLPVAVVGDYLDDPPTRANVRLFAEHSLDPTDPHDLAEQLKAERAARFRAERELRQERGAAQRRASLFDQLLSPTELAKRDRPTALVEGLLYADTLAQLAGEPGTGKTFAALSIACSLATGTGALGGRHRVPKARPVLYVAAEGTSGLHDRIAAWCASNQVDPAALDGQLHVLAQPVQLGEPDQVADLTLAARRVSAGLVVLDTRARCTVGLEENSATDMGRAIDAAEQVRQVSDATVLVVHHSAKGSAAPRGSTAWDGALWTDLRLTSDGDGDARDVTITCYKHKDVPDGCEHVFRLSPQPVPALPGSVDPPRGSLVLTAADPFAEPPKASPKVEQVLEVLGQVAGTEGVTRAQLLDVCKEEHGASRTTVYRAVSAGEIDGRVAKVGSRSPARYRLATAD